MEAPDSPAPPTPESATSPPSSTPAAPKSGLAETMVRAASLLLMGAVAATAAAATLGVTVLALRDHRDRQG